MAVADIVEGRFGVHEQRPRDVLAVPGLVVGEVAGVVMGITAITRWTIV